MHGCFVNEWWGMRVPGCVVCCVIFDVTTLFSSGCYLLFGRSEVWDLASRKTLPNPFPVLAGISVSL